MSAADIRLPVLGMDLLSEDARLAAGAVRAAVNVDIDRDGQFSARRGFVTRLSGHGFSAIGAWAGRCWVQQGRQVGWLDGNWRITPLFDAGDTAMQQPVAAMEYNADLWFAAPNGLWRVRAGEDAARQAARMPVRPRVRGTDVGALTPGVYGVAVSMLTGDGEESPAVWLGAVRSGGGLELDGLPVVMGAHWQVYITPADGDVLYAAERMAALLPRMAVGTPPKGQMCDVMGLQPLPGGHAIAHMGARVFVAAGDVLCFSRPFRPWYWHPAHDFVRFVGRIRFVQAVGGGLFVGDDRGVWWLQGDDPSDARLRHASTALALAGSSLLLPSHCVAALADGQQAPAAVWLSQDGYMLGMAGGDVRALQPQRLALDASHAARSVLVRRDGRAQVVTLTNEYEPRAMRERLGVAVDQPVFV